jgi:hypothetical protein
MPWDVTPDIARSFAYWTCQSLISSTLLVPREEPGGLLTDGEQKGLDEEEHHMIDQCELSVHIQHLICLLESSAPHQEAVFKRELLKESENDEGLPIKMSVTWRYTKQCECEMREA